MDVKEFDRFADEYRSLHASNVRTSGESPEYFAEYKIRDMARWYSASGPVTDRMSILDLGAGVGNSVPYFRRYFPNSELVCLDVSSKSLEIAEQRFAGEADFVRFDGGVLPFTNSRFDVAFAACVFHHVDGREHPVLLDELKRVLRPDGRLFVFEHNPFNPLTVHAVNTCPFDENAVLINGSRMKRMFRQSGFSDVSLRYRLFFPRMLSAFRRLEDWMQSVPLGAQYYVTGSRS